MQKNMTYKIICLSFAVVLFLTLVLTGCAKKPEVIRIGVNDWPPCEVWYIAQELGYFENVPVELIRFSVWSDNMASLYTGKIDITHSTLFNSVYHSNRGEASLLWFPIDYSEGSDGLVVKKGISNIADLKGKKIGVEVGTDEHYLLYQALQKNGVSIKEVTLQSIPSYESHKNFVNNEVDAIFTYEPFLSQAATEGEGNILFTTKDIPGHMVDTLVINKTNYSNHKKDYDIVKKAWFKSLDYIRSNPDQAYAMMAKNEKMTPEAFKAFYESFTFYDEATATALRQSPELKEKLIFMNDFCVDAGLTKEASNLDQLLE